MYCHQCDALKHLMHTPSICEDCWWKQRDTVYATNERVLDLAQVAAWALNMEPPQVRVPRWKVGWEGNVE